MAMKLKGWIKVALTIAMLVLILFIPVTSTIAIFTAPAKCDAWDIGTHVVVRGWGDGIPRRVTEPYVTCTNYSVVSPTPPSGTGEE